MDNQKHSDRGRFTIHADILIFELRLQPRISTINQLIETNCPKYKIWLAIDDTIRYDTVLIHQHRPLRSNQPTNHKIADSMTSTDNQVLPRKLWEHPDPKSTQLWKFMQEVNRKSGRNLQVRNSPEFVHTNFGSVPVPQPLVPPEPVLRMCTKFQSLVLLPTPMPSSGLKLGYSVAPVVKKNISALG